MHRAASQETGLSRLGESHALRGSDPPVRGEAALRSLLPFRFAVATASALFLVTSARAQVVDLPDAQIDLGSPEISLSTGTATVIDTSPDQGTGATLVDVLERVPGVSLRRFGGPGSFVGLTIRGIGGDNLAVVLDDLPLASATLGPIDLGLYPLESIDRVELYRGSGPVRFGSPIGGVLRLLTEPPTDATRLRGGLGYGAFSSRQVHASAAGPLSGSLRYSAHVGYNGTRGDFPYYDDRATLYTADDDVLRRRRNNAADGLSARLSLHADGPAGGTWKLAGNGTWRAQGIAGNGAQLSSEASAEDREASVRLSLVDATLAGERLRAAAGLDGLFASRAFRDPLREVRLSASAIDAQLGQLGLDGRFEWLWSLSHETELSPRLGFERYEQSGTPDAMALYERALERQRTSLGAGLEHRWDVSEWLRLVPSLRADVGWDGGSQVDDRSGDAQLSPRLGALVPLGPCELRGNAGRYHRLPTLVERYGDGIVSVPNPDLVPERGLATDLGGACKTEVPRLGRLRAELTGFHTRAEELIGLVQSSPFATQARNLGAARMRGVEAGLAAEARSWRADLAYTLTDAVSTAAGLMRGKRAPGIPLHRATLLAELGPSWARLRYETTLASQLYLDQANLRPVPPRLLHDAGISSEHEPLGLTVKLMVHNLTNTLVESIDLAGAASGQGRAKLADFIGYPLPGRSWFVSLSWRST